MYKMLSFSHMEASILYFAVIWVSSYCLVVISNEITFKFELGSENPPPI